MIEDKKEKLEVQIKSADMTDDMQQEVIEVAHEAMQKYNIEKVSSRRLLASIAFGSLLTSCEMQDIAQYIKKEFDSRKGATWHCIVGRNFGSFVTHGISPLIADYELKLRTLPETKHFIYFYLGHCAILLFKTQ
ncbi:MAG: Dynein light chain [Geoglossum umbratile]|nr:MAG: Dynein light chain [Geoglossum umbratile]